jgi:cell division septation protein DedD
MEPTTQLELFEVPRQAPHRRRHPAFMGNLQIRQDDAALLAMASLIGVSVLFAIGVERGKQFARTAPSLMIPRPSAAPPAEPALPAMAGKPAGSVKKAPTAPTKKAAARRSRFAVQVVSYRQAKLAQQELQRLKRQGEPAFLLMKQDRTALLIGPFPTKQTASTKLASLKRRYPDCFIQHL